MATYTLAEVEKHKDSQSGVWMVIHGKVYDVSKFLDEHPGGSEILLENSGVDSTVAFDDVGHSTDARELLKDYLIGDLAKPEEPSGNKCCASWVVPATLLLAAVVIYKFVIARK